MGQKAEKVCWYESQSRKSVLVSLAEQKYYVSLSHRTAIIVTYLTDQ